jgi:Stress responsive A/B Barrel Domain
MANRLMHAVVFWLRADTPDDTAAAMEGFYRDRISQVAGVEHVFVGHPAGTDREVVDGSYQVMSSIVFADAAAQTAWQSDPVHDAFRERFGPHFDRVIVYDTSE